MGAERLAYSATFDQQAFKYGDRTFAFQFHPEVTKNSFRSWQNNAAAMLNRPGVQTPEDQEKLMHEHDQTINDWFMDFLDGLFGPALEKVRNNNS